MVPIENIKQRLKNCIIHALELEISAAEVDDEQQLFDSPEGKGLAGDSLAALEIVAAMAAEFKIMPTEIDEEHFYSISTLSLYIQNQIEESLLK